MPDPKRPDLTGFWLPFLFERRKAKLSELSRAEIARAVGVNEPLIARWFKGEIYPVPENLERLANYFDVPAALFCEGNATAGTPEALSWSRALGHWLKDMERHGISLDQFAEVANVLPDVVAAWVEKALAPTSDEMVRVLQSHPPFREAYLANVYGQEHEDGEGDREATAPYEPAPILDGNGSPHALLQHAGWLDARGGKKRPKPPPIPEEPSVMPMYWFERIAGSGVSENDVFLLIVVGAGLEPDVNDGGVVFCSRRRVKDAWPVTLDASTGGGYRLWRDGLVPDDLTVQGYVIHMMRVRR
jgi:helix-turn-helix protein